MINTNGGGERAKDGPATESKTAPPQKSPYEDDPTMFDLIRSVRLLTASGFTCTFRTSLFEKWEFSPKHS